MNLCGPDNGVIEHEMVIPIPDEKFTLSSRKKKLSSGSRSSRSSRSVPSNQSAPSKSGTLNPVSRHDYEKLRNRQRSQPTRGKRSTSILMRKLESGFNLTWISGKRNTHSVFLTINSDKSYLRIRMRSRDEEESENDGLRMNQRDLKIRVRHIAGIGSEKQSSSGESRDDYDSFQNKRFIIKLKNFGSQGENKFLFVAESPAERDTVILAIRSLLDQGKHVQESRSTKDQSIDYRGRSDDVNERSFRALKIRDQSRGTMRECEAGTRDNSAIESRDDNAVHVSDDCERDVFFDTYERPFENIESEREPPPVKLTRRKSYSRIERNESGSSSRTLKRRQYSAAAKGGHDTRREGRSNSRSRSRSPRLLERRRSDHSNAHRTRRTVNEDFLLIEDEGIGCLGVSTETEMACHAAAQTTGPWCTDDICTASLKDFADSMTGIFELKHSNDGKGLSTNDLNHKVVAEEYLSGFLGRNANVGELLSVRDLWNVAAMKRPSGLELEQRKFQNRARKADGKAKRYKNLKKQMTFNGAEDEHPMCLQTAHSYDEEVLKMENSSEEDLLYYDSDPEDAREAVTRKNPRATLARFEKESCQTHRRRREALEILDSSRFGMGRKWKRLGHEVISDIIEATKNERLSLLWHPTQNNTNSNMSPVCVKVWVESGIYLADGTFLLPKLTWLPAHEGKLESRKLNVSHNSPGSLELLDVSRVKECENIDRRLHPFAHVDRSFVIQTQNGNFLFETQSAQERGRVVNGLKLVIARLASLLMLRDLRAVDEFFGGTAVPGEAPAWARGTTSNESSLEFESR